MINLLIALTIVFGAPNGYPEQPKGPNGPTQPCSVV